VLLQGDSSLPRGERELIAAYVSSLNRCEFCRDSRSAFAAARLANGAPLVEAVLADPAAAPIGAKLRALLALAALVQEGGRHVTAEAVRQARSEGATDMEIHDAVHIAAAFCMYNRYVDGLATSCPPSREAYRELAPLIVEHGYAAGVELLCGQVSAAG
jgi:uncharacterized peroxidase-related enzyme